MRDFNDPSSSIIAAVTVQLIIRYILIILFCMFWVGPVILPWITQLVIIITGG